MKAYVTIGIPASGKSTWADNQEGFVNINLDDCRREICGDEGNQTVTPQAVLLHSQKIKEAASLGSNIIISDTNLNTKFRNELERTLVGLGYDVEYVLFPVSLEMAKSRNAKRSRVVPDYVLEKMVLSYQGGVPSGKIVLAGDLISDSVIPELNRLVNLQILSPSTELGNQEEKVVQAGLVTVNQGEWLIGPQLINWLTERGLLILGLSSYLVGDLESRLSVELNNFDDLSLLELPRIVKSIFYFPTSEEVNRRVSLDIMQNKSLIKTCFNEKDQLVSSAKLAEIIKEIIK